MYIPDNEMKFFNMVTVDELGEVFTWKGRIYRGIFPEACDVAESYLKSGFLDELIAKSLFPVTKKSEHTNERYCFILEHDKIIPPITDSEWSFEMLRDAALMIIELARIAHRYGYDMVDCHAKNVMFRNNKPMYVDLGSFVKRGKGATGYAPYFEFLSCYYYVLKLRGYGMVKVPSVLKNITFIPEVDYKLINSPLWRLSPRLLVDYCQIKRKLYNLTLCNDSRLENSHGISKLILSIINVTKPFGGQHLNRIERKIRKLKIGSHNNERNCSKLSLPQQILELIKDVDCMIVNPDMLMRSIQDITSVTRSLIVCDCLDDIGNVHYKKLRGQEICAQSIVYDYCFPYVRHNSQKAPEERLKPTVIMLVNPIEIQEQTGKSFLVALKSFHEYHSSYLIIVSQKDSKFPCPDNLYVTYDTIDCEDYNYLILKKKE